MNELPTFYRMTTPTAAHETKCCECEGKIAKGETYVRHIGVWSDKHHTYKVCQPCEQLRTEYVRDCDLYPDETPAFGSLGDALLSEGSTVHAERFLANQQQRKMTQ